MEKIVCYFDGQTLLNFKLLSKTCNDIAYNAIRYNKLWKKFCLEEIPKKYFIDLLTKQFVTKVPLDSLSDIQYERIYKCWLQWQKPVFNVSRIGQHHFLGLDGVINIICHKFDVMVIFSNFMYLFSIKKNENTKNYVLRNTNSEICKTNALVALNPKPQRDPNTGTDNFYINCRQKNTNICPLHNRVNVIHDGTRREHYTGTLVDVDMNVHANVCCWVRETWYEWHSNDSSFINGHLCPHLSYILFTSVVHGLIISRNQTNSILIHGIFKDSCFIVPSWLKNKYAGPTAVYLYTNILFVGTQNGYLLAYRLQCMDDLTNLKEKNLLLEVRLDIGGIIMLDIMDFEDLKAIIVASTTSVLWIKIN